MIRNQRNLLLAMVFLSLQACNSLPEDHLLRLRSQQITKKLGDKFDRDLPARTLAKSFRNISATAQKLNPSHRRSISKLRRNISSYTKSVGDGFRRTPSRTAAQTMAMASDMNRRLRSLWSENGTLAKIVAPQRSIQSMKHAGQTAWVVLGMERRILPSPTDIERRTDTLPVARRETWPERIIRRVLR